MLIHIGYHKTGTSWLQKHLFGDRLSGLQTLGKAEDDHPIRRLVLARSLEFDARDCRAEFEPLLRPVEAEGLLPVVSYERLSGHPCSGGYDAKEIANRIAEVFPSGSVLIVIREQRNMIVSTYKQYVKGGGPCSLRQFLEPPTTTNLRVPWFDFRHFEYDHLLRHYRDLFGPTRVLVLPFEQFLRDPAAFVTEIGRFVGRPVRAELLESLPYDRREQRPSSATEIAVRRRCNRLVRSELNPAPIFESRRPDRLKKLAKSRAIEALVPRRLAARREASLHRAVAEIVGDRYLASNRATAELTGLDLGTHGWMI